jgi:hypothetical protein
VDLYTPLYRGKRFGSETVFAALFIKVFHGSVFDRCSATSIQNFPLCYSA